MRIVAISDLHGHLPEIPSCDLLLIGGDLGPATQAYHHTDFAYEWLDDIFKPWLALNQAKCSHIVGIAGNHDFIAEEDSEFLSDLPWIYLNHKSHMVEGLKIFGSPYTPKFYDWAFMLPECNLSELWADIPLDTDILLTHGPRFCCLDRSVTGMRCGSLSLRNRVNELREKGNLKLHIFGHIHEAYGNMGFSYNVSHMNEKYKPVNSPMILDGCFLL